MAKKKKKKIKLKKKSKRARKSGQVYASTSFSATKFKSLIASVDIAARAIVKEIVDEMNLTLMATGKAFTPNALDEWVPKLTTAVRDRLLDGGNWTNDRANVLAVASDMALIGAILSGTSSAVNKGRVHASFRAVKDHATCPGGLGAGRWCDFDI
jgi:hypothetical protein